MMYLQVDVCKLAALKSVDFCPETEPKDSPSRSTPWRPVWRIQMPAELAVGAYVVLAELPPKSALLSTTK